MCPSQPNCGPTGDLPVPDMLCNDLSAQPLAGLALAGMGQQARLQNTNVLASWLCQGFLRAIRASLWCIRSHPEARLHLESSQPLQQLH